MTFSRLLLVGSFGAISASAQLISFGILGGAPFNDVVNSINQSNVAYVSNSTNFTVGPSLRVGLPLNFRFEVDALYRPYSFLVTPSDAPSATASASEWRFPFLLQYRFGTPLVKPFVEAGVSFDHLAAISQAAHNIASINESNAGFVVGGGVDLKIPFVRLSGELRYTRQGSQYFEGLSNLNQAEVLFGIHF